MSDVTLTVLRWEDGGGPNLADQLRSRPGLWAVVATDLIGWELENARNALMRLGWEYEYDVRACNDGEYGLEYEARARYVGSAASSEETNHG